MSSEGVSSLMSSVISPSLSRSRYCARGPSNGTILVIVEEAGIPRAILVETLLLVASLSNSSSREEASRTTSLLSSSIRLSTATTSSSGESSEMRRSARETTSL
ncbi:hypothetical protein TIFTF001_032262 [Ficus carica]|uniref:Uncharacterized protein n=1 Tax=Ficus carica TaxID=3494 RepID=A0AA88E039_FICCA|nr:hypothetical protein TIFTF001_032262 [Ficus carica]